MKKLLILLLLLLATSCTMYYRKSEFYTVELRDVDLGKNYIFEYVDTNLGDGDAIIRSKPFLRIKIKNGQITYIRDSINITPQTEEDYFIFMDWLLGFSVRDLAE